MKRILSTISLLVLVVVEVLGISTPMTYEISLKLADYIIRKDRTSNKISINSDYLILGFGDDPSQPALPMQSVSVALPRDTRIAGYSLNVIQRELVDTNVYVMPNPQAIVFGEQDDDEIEYPDYGCRHYPDSVLLHTGEIIDSKIINN